MPIDLGNADLLENFDSYIHFMGKSAADFTFDPSAFNVEEEESIAPALPTTQHQGSEPDVAGLASREETCATKPEPKIKARL